MRQAIRVRTLPYDDSQLFAPIPNVMPSPLVDGSPEAISDRTVECFIFIIIVHCARYDDQHKTTHFGAITVVT